MPHVEPTPDQYDRLHRFLSSAFSPEALHSLLLRLDGGRAVAHELPSTDEAPLRYFHRAAERLWQHGLLQVSLFELLLQQRPHRSREVLEIATLFGVDLDSPASSPDASASLARGPTDAASLMHPTFGRWCRDRAGPLVALVAASLGAGGLALALGPADANASAAEAPRLAMKVGQAVLSALALVCVALTRTPGSSRLFGPSPTHERMWRRLGAIEDASSPRASTLRAAAGADPQTREAVTHWLDAAIEAREQIRQS